ncbi:hypothetical protein KSS87_013432, partial [Heliosperma pusillum]
MKGHNNLKHQCIKEDMMVQPRRRMTYYTDNEGQQTIQSVTNLHDVPNISSSTFVPSKNM